MARRHTGFGLTHLYTDTTNFVQGALYNFDFDWHELKEEHRDWLDFHLLLKFRTGASVSLTGQASRAGHADYNIGLSQRRVHAVRAYLASPGNPPLTFLAPRGAGEAPAKAAGQPDEFDDQWYRSVLVSAWNHPIPPRPPGLIRRR